MHLHPGITSWCGHLPPNTQVKLIKINKSNLNMILILNKSKNCLIWNVFLVVFSTIYSKILSKSLISIRFNCFLKEVLSIDKKCFSKILTTPGDQRFYYMLYCNHIEFVMIGYFVVKYCNQLTWYQFLICYFVTR